MKKIPILIKEDSPFLTAETRKTRWAIPYDFECLNARIDKLLRQNLDDIKGKKILDIGSHIGTFSYSALKLGAIFVQGIDTEKKTIERGKELFKQTKVDESQYNFQVGDALGYLESLEEGSFDTIFCLGTLYYMVEPHRLLQLMQKVAKKTILIDTFTASYSTIQGKEAPLIYKAIKEETLKLPMMLTVLTQPEKKSYRLPHSFQHNKKDLSLITLPTCALLETWFQSLGMPFELIDWSDHKKQPCTYHDLLNPEQKKSSHWADIYTSGVRVSYSLKTNSPNL